MARILITGGSGLLGLNWAIARRKAGDDVHLWTNTRDIQLENITTHRGDLSDIDTAADGIRDIAPDIIINSAGFTSVDGCASNPKQSQKSNVDVAQGAAMIAANIGAKFIHISTDHLFDGKAAFVSETAPPKPQNTYAEHKAKAEEMVRSAYPSALILRTSFFGWGTRYRRSFSDLILDDLKDGRQVQMYDDVFFTPLEASQVISLAHKLLALGHSGVINLCSHERISKYDFSVKLAEAFGYDSGLIQPIQAARLKNVISRPKDLSLSDEKLRGVLGCDGITIDSTIASLKHHEPRKDALDLLGRTIPYGKHFIDQADIDAVTNTLKSGFLTQGPAIPAFEERIAAYVGAKYAVAVASGTAGLHLAYCALGVDAGKTVLTSPITFVATANAAYYCGGSARFADIDPMTINISPDAVKKALAQHDDIHLVAPVLFSGAAEGIPEIAKIAKEKGKYVVEDAAHGLGGAYACGAKIGSCRYSDCTVFSLHPVKSIAAGEGGIITTNDSKIYRRLLRLRSHGINKSGDAYVNADDAYTDGVENLWYYEMAGLGYHYRLTDIQASLANSQLNKLDMFVARRRVLAHRYMDMLKDIPHIKRAQNINIDLSANHL
ncbi:MAG: DegT/DnrJ/EryC1/StrS family aminotransferase, partial [Candidatus Puniceispirillales bacterium WSBS_2018_MAG_OTU23]